MRVTEIVFARGHREVRGTHPLTLEITKDEHLTSRGDCIVAVSASKGAKDLNLDFKSLVRKPGSRVSLLIKAGNYSEKIEGFGDPELTFTHPTDLVVRRSTYVCSRTLMVKSNVAAKDLPRRMIRELRNSENRVEIQITVEV
ncbi:MAG: DUF371 domain-containing protein [Candidatus Bathyarchaeota archaeon]